MAALDEFHQSGLKPDLVFALTVLKIAAASSSAELTARALRLVSEARCAGDLRVRTAVVSALGRCGDDKRAREWFEAVPPAQRDLPLYGALLWSALSAADPAGLVHEVVHSMQSAGIDPIL